MTVASAKPFSFETERPEILDLCRRRTGQADPRDIHRISHTDLGYHPDSVISTFENLRLLPRQLPFDAVYGIDFVAVRIAPTDNYTIERSKVTCIHLCGSSILKEGAPARDEDLRDVFDLAEGKVVRGWRKI
ncbi:MAG: hypothetical protein FJZ64_02175 [Chlamydiae bacterium]|nr:hypothetical protein [Chlamydiota bacterium]